MSTMGGIDGLGLVGLAVPEARDRSAGQGVGGEGALSFAAVAHELRGPIGTFQGLIGILKEMLAEGRTEEAARIADRIVACGGRMESALGAVEALAGSGAPAHGCERVDLRRVVEDVLAELEPAVTASGAVVDVGPLPVIEADPRQMRLLMRNLLANALKYRRPGIQPWIRVDGMRDGGTCRMRVRDNGTGFREEFRGRIFGLFQRGHAASEFGGSGVGLALCRKIARAHGGDIRAWSQPGAGSVFEVELPAAA